MAWNPNPSERSIQDRLYYYLRQKGQLHIIPNVMLYGWESDMLSVTKAGFVHEFEIKISRNDFFADAKKTEKHCIVKNGWRELNAHEQFSIDNYKPLPAGHYLQEHLTEDNKYKSPFRPNYFWYVCPMGMIQPSEIPDHAGFIELHDRGYLHQIKNAERLHKEKALPLLYARLLSSFEARYWSLRIRR